MLRAALLSAGVLAALDVSGTKVVDDLAELARCCNAVEDPEAVAAGAVTRLVFSPEDVLARTLIKQWMTAAGLEVREDAIGNLFGRWRGKMDSEPVLTGSHVDAIPLAGRYDGTLGVVGALEAIRALQRDGYKPTRSIDVLYFTSEEPTRFGLSCLGSRAMAGYLNASTVEALRDENGLSVEEAAKEAGYGRVRSGAGMAAILEEVRADFLAEGYSAHVE